MTAWLRAMFISIICTIGMAGAGLNPALASLCAPVIQTDLHAQGDALLAYAPVLSMDLDGAGSEQLDVLDENLIGNIRDWSKPRDVYAVEWSGGFELGCSGGSDYGLSVYRYRSLEGLFSFTHDFFRFVEGIDPVKGMNYSLSNRMDHRSGVRIEAQGDFLGPNETKGSGNLKGGFSVDVWELKDYARTSLHFNKPEGITTMKMQETTYRRPMPGDVLPPGAKPFKGGGYALGARITWLPSDRMSFTYVGERLFGREWATGLVYETYDLETNKQFIGIGGYLENRPLAIGMRKSYEFNERLTPTHRIEGHFALNDWTYLSGRFNWDHYNIEKLTIGVSRSIWSGHVNVGLDVANQALGGTIFYPIEFQGTSLHSRINFQLNHIVPSRVSLFQIGGSIMASF